MPNWKGPDPAHWVCPRNGEPGTCLRADKDGKPFPCGGPHTHRVEALTFPGKPPVCETHGIDLVRVDP